MPTINRYIKDTIKSCHWETQITENEDGTFELWKGYFRKDSADLIKEEKEVLTKEQAEQYKEKNKEDLIETYTI